MKALHFRAPFLGSCGAAIEVSDQYGVTKTAVSFDMEPIAPEEP